MDHDDKIIKSVPYFRTLNDETFSKLIAATTVVDLNEQAVLFHEGDFADAFYIVKAGAVRITTIDNHGDTIFLARIAAGGFFGEQAFSPSSSPRRQATVTAQLESVLYKIPRQFLLSLHHVDNKIKLMLEKQNLAHLKEKLHKVASDIQNFTYNISDLTSNALNYAKYSLIYMQDEAAAYLYLLVSGEVELRRYDEKKQLQQIVNVNPGQTFGAEHFERVSTKKNKYHHNAIVKHDACIIGIDISQYHKLVEQHPLLGQLCVSFNRGFAFAAKGKILQFRSEYFGMPSITSIISLNDHREIICQQIENLNIFLAIFSNQLFDTEIKYTQEKKYNRELRLAHHKIVGLLDENIAEDSYDLFNLMTNEIELSEAQIDEFKRTGRISIAPSSDKAEIVCKCMQISRDTINKLIQSGVTTLPKIHQQTGAGTVCGGCNPIILEMFGTDAWTPCVVSKVIDHYPEVKSFLIKPISQEIPKFKPGQYLIIKSRIKNVWVMRNYTLTSTPNNPYFEISVKKEEKGIFSPWLFANARKNIIIYVSGPYGNFTVDETINVPIVCLMGGIGITPGIAFLRYFSEKKFTQKIYVDYSVKYAEQFILSDELERLSQKHKNMIINHRITSIQGKLTEKEIQKIISSLKGCHLYVCGPKALETLAIDVFNKMHLTPERLHVEEFIHSGAPSNMSQIISE